MYIRSVKYPIFRLSVDVTVSLYKNMMINSAQRKILIIAAFIYIIMGLFPPWVYTYDFRTMHSENPAGYALIFDPPWPDGNNEGYGVRIDISRISVQWITLALVTASALLLVSGSRKEAPK